MTDLVFGDTEEVVEAVADALVVLVDAGLLRRGSTVLDEAIEVLGIEQADYVAAVERKAAGRPASPGEARRSGRSTDGVGEPKLRECLGRCARILGPSAFDAGSDVCRRCERKTRRYLLVQRKKATQAVSLRFRVLDGDEVGACLACRWPIEAGDVVLASTMLRHETCPEHRARRARR